MEQKPPDVVVVGREWPERALLRAQLIEEGYEVVAVDEWPIPRPYRRPGMKPRALLIDLHELPKPRETLDEVRFVLPVERVLVITSLGSLTADEVKRLGFRVLERPVSIREIISAIGALISRTPPEGHRNGTTSAGTE
jgi:DNA-binding response OmpR family regulator